MFEILKALLAVQKACADHGTSLRWSVESDEFGPMLRGEISLTDADQKFVEQMQELLAPVEES